VNRRTPQSEEDWFHRAVQYLARFDRTAAQVQQFLFRNGAARVQVEQVISRLTGLGYLDDRAYAVRWLEATLSRRPMGAERLRTELVAKGLAEAVADDAIAEGLDGIPEETLARRALTLRARAGRPLSPWRQISLLRQRGFGEETIERIMGDWTGKERPS